MGLPCERGHRGGFQPFGGYPYHQTGDAGRLASLAAVFQGRIDAPVGKPQTPIIEASSGSTAISEADFARLLGLRLIAVVPDTTAHEKLENIAFYKGQSHLVHGADMYYEAHRLAGDLGGHCMDQFAFAERATDWRGNNNIADSLFSQMEREPKPYPSWIVVGAGTGGTAATIGRYMRFRCFANCPTRLCVADPERSVYYDVYCHGYHGVTNGPSLRIEGIGRPRVEERFLPSIIDHMSKVPDAASIGAVRFLERWLGRRCGGRQVPISSRRFGC